jgi:hypothetical protein
LQGGLEGSKRVLFFHFHGLVAWTKHQK